MMMMTKKSNNNGRIPKLEKELNNRIVELTEEQEIKPWRWSAGRA